MKNFIFLYFAIKGSLSLTQPGMADNETLVYGGTPYLIKWNTLGAVANVDLYYSTDSGGSYPNKINAAPVPATQGTAGYSWTVPNSILGKVMKVKVVDVLNSDVYSESDYTFTIVGSIELTKPVGDETWYVGTPDDISWIPTGSWSNVEIQYSTDGGSGWTTIATPSAGTSGVEKSYSVWSPGVADITTQFKVKIFDPNYPSLVTDESTTNNKIFGAIQVTQPTSTGIVWYKDESREIRWTGTGYVNPIKIELSTDGGSSWLPTPIATLI